MPAAHAGETKYAYLDHDTDVVDENPPILNQWYTVFDAEDVRLLWCAIEQNNDEALQKILELRWTIDGNIYFIIMSLDSTQWNWAYRDHRPSTGGTSGLESGTDVYNAALSVDKRGQSFKVEIRITDVVGTNQRLQCYCVRETLEQT